MRSYEQKYIVKVLTPAVDITAKSKDYERNNLSISNPCKSPYGKFIFSLVLTDIFVGPECDWGQLFPDGLVAAAWSPGLMRDGQPTL